MYNIMKSILDEGVRLAQTFNLSGGVKTSVHPCNKGDNTLDKQTLVSLGEALSIDVAEGLAIERFLDGEKAGFSSDVIGNTTAGYGLLDEFGEWEFPLHVNQETLDILDRKGGRL